MIHISWPFYTNELRQLIKKLKAEGKLRDEPLLYLDKEVAKIIVFISIPWMMILLWGGYSPLSYRITIITMLIGVLSIAVRSCIRKIIIPYTIGYLVNAHIVSPVKYGARTIRSGTAWFFDYEIYDENAPPEIQGKTFEANGFPKSTSEIPCLCQGDSISVIVHSDTPNLNVPYFPSRAKTFRLTTTPINSLRR